MKITLFAITCLLLFSSFNSKLPIKYIYLTFDDGPLKGSENIDSVVLAERLKISVFLVGEHVEESRKFMGYYNMYEQNPFIESYNHSFTHAHNKYKEFYSNAQNVLADIQKNEQALHLHFKIVRLPGRNIWRIGSRVKDDGPSGKAAADLLAANGFSLIGWDLEWQHKDADATPIQTVDQMTREIETRLATGDHLVVLLHDEMFQKKWEESELHQLIDNLRKHENYVFEHVRFYPRK
ncbi:polysaccharide deacetylase family protein [Chitinophaga niabensis]|uniref:Peptidoglycan/xylan/chitin deacetylase, PgdA/CDA1 family n=1 Tax=Chitinophaga niabensis TaxID=536979 RepID=A0A1N6EBM0_9BACT|nr:polysaccharide deacetylase family protein [Chitinophaga niabensis]SIN80432.1 Peptidoglycan/xylan/chitin deacetylase, PgdA/CDA1 family [Chitinophaga niabensis]